MLPDEPVPPRPDVSTSRLVGWKEISAYLRRSIRTVQRWEGESNLPIRRYPTKRGEGVFALPEELDAWLKSAPGSVASQANGNGHGDSHGNGDAVDSDRGAHRAEINVEHSSDALDQPAHAVPEAKPAELANAPTSGLLRSVLRRPLARAVLAVVVLALCVHVWFVNRRSAAIVQPTVARVVGNDIVAFDAVGKLLWRYGLEARTKPPGPGVEPVLVEDIDGDGRREVVAALGGEPLQLNQVLCLEANGTKRWSRRPDRLAHFGFGAMGAPWVPILAKVTGPRDHRSLWVSWANSPFFGAFVERLDARSGMPNAVYWSAGYVTALEVGEVAGHPSLLLGAANNERVAASLAVYDLAVQAGGSPSANPKYACQDCPAGRPTAFFVFPKTDLSRAAISETAPTAVRNINVTQTGFIIAIAHFPPGLSSPTINTADALYRFDRDLRLMGAETVDGYREFHRELEREGKLKAPHSNAEERQLFPVLSWDGTKYVELTPAI